MEIQNSKRIRRKYVFSSRYLTRFYIPKMGGLWLIADVCLDFTKLLVEMIVGLYKKRNKNTYFKRFLLNKRIFYKNRSRYFNFLRLIQN